MTLAELIKRFRTESNDLAEPYFISDESVTLWLNDALKEACMRGRLLYEKDDKDLCFIAYPSGTTAAKLSPLWIEIEKTSIVQGTNSFLDLPIVSPEEVYRKYGEDYQSFDNLPVCTVLDDNELHIFPSSNKAITVKIAGYRLSEPLSSLTDEPEIHHLHHRHLVDYALAKAFSVPDAEFFDQNRAMIAEQKFIEYFGLPCDSDFRRITREDRPHINQPFWI